MRNDPNHYYERIGELRNRLADGRFVDNDVRTFDFESVARSNPDFGVHLLSARRLFPNITDDFLDSLDEVERRALSEVSSTMRETLRSIHQQALNSGNSSVHREHLNTFSAQSGRLAAITSSVFVGRFFAGEGQVAARSEALERMTSEALNEMRTQSSELQQRIQEDLTQAAVAKNANFFHTEASRYAKLSFWWGAVTFAWFSGLIAAAGAVALNASLTGQFLANLKAYVPTMPDQWLLLQVLASKVFVVGALTYVGVVLVKAFMSVLNAHVTNRHRAVSLDTYKFLLDGAQSDADRQAIIQRAAEAVFALQDTGLIKSVPGSEAAPFNTTINLPKLT